MNRSRVIAISLILGLVFAITGSVIAVGAEELPDKLIHGFDANYPPYTWMNEQGKATGFDIEVVDWIAENQGFEVVHKPTSWSGIILALRSGEIDFIASGMTMNPERAKKARFTIPYDSYTSVIAVRRDSDLTLEKLKGGKKQKVSCQLGATSDKWVDRLKKRGWNIEKLGLGSYVEAAAAVLQGRADAVLSDSTWTGPNLKKERYANLKVIAPIGPTYYYGYAVRQGDQAILNALNEGLQNIMGTAKWRELREKYDMAL